MTIATKDGRTIEADGTALKKKAVVLDSGESLSYAEIESIATDDFKTYEKAVKRTSRDDRQHVTVKYTGSEDVDLLGLEKLGKKRQGAHAARGAGGLLMLLGVLSADREVAALGVATYGAGTIAKDWNTDKTLEAQTQAIANMKEKQERAEKADSLEEQYRIEYGDENVDSLIALIDGNHERALALANVAETSDDANYRFAAVWMKAIIFADKGDRAAVEREYDRLIVLDPEVSSYEDGDRWMELLLKDLSEMREV